MIVFHTIFRRIILTILAVFVTSVHSEDISLQLHWKNQFQFAGYYIAQEKGFYKEKDLSVTLKEFGNNIDVIDDVLSNKADFAIGGSSLLVEKLSGKEIVALAAIFQSSPQVLATTKSKNIKSLQDLKNKRLMVTEDFIKSVTIQAMLTSKGIDLKELEILPHSYNPEDIIENKTDLMASYISNEPFVLQEMGEIPVVFDPKDYGFDVYSDILFTSQEQINKKPQVVKNFLEASLRGWQYSFENIEETAKLIYEKFNTQNKSLKSLIYEGEELRKLAYFKGARLGEVDLEKLHRIFDIYKVMGVIESPRSFEPHQLLQNLVYKRDLESSFIKDSKVELTPKELEYIRKHPVVRMCANQDWNPIEFTNGQGKPEGISIDILDLIQKKLDNKLSYTHIPTRTWTESQKFLEYKSCDILPSAVKTATREKYAKFTTPYLSFEIVIVTREDAPFIKSIDEIAKKRIVRKRGSGLVEILKNDYKMQNVIETNTIKDSFKMVSQDEAFAVITNLHEASYYIQKYGYNNLKVSGYTDIEYDVSIAVRDDNEMLFSILQKTLDSLSEQEKINVLNNWGQNTLVETGWSLTSEEITFIVGFFILLLLLVAVLVNRELKKQVLASTKELREAKQQAEKANNTKTEFLANMSHEIRTPMNAVLGFCEILSQTHLKKEQKEYLEAIKASSKSLLYIINDILDISKIESGKMEKIDSPCDIRAIFKEIEYLFTLTADRKDLILKINLDEDLPDVLMLDETKFKQILINLVSNAIKFTSKGRVLISVFAVETSNDSYTLVFSVSDTGIGIKKEEREKIFENFTQQSGQDAKKYGGTGLGLAITKNIVTLLGGEITVDSKESEGSSFRVRLHNLKKADNEKDKNKNYVVEFKAGSKILVVEDEDSNRGFLVEYLKKRGFTVVEAQNGADGLNELFLEKPDLVISDLRMPVLDGFDFIKKVREDKVLNHLPIVALSASVLDEKQNKSLDIGFNDFLTKPVDFDDLERILKKYISNEIFITKESEVEDAQMESISDVLKEQLQDLLDVALRTGDFEEYGRVVTFCKENEVFTEKQKALDEALITFDVDSIEKIAIDIRKKL